ncbi:MAG: PLP-dependent cysteine synthase family protein [Vulcanimicrobiota bacterium]
MLSLIGNTPLLRLPTEGPVEIWAKLESANPGGSVKDRPALFMLDAAERSGLLTPDRIIIDATSGNTGIAYALIAAARGYRVELCIPSNASNERKRILEAYGARLVLTDPLEMTDGAIREARARVEARPEHYYYPDQYNNPANPQAHYATTGPELWTQTDGRITHFVTGLGTTGTFMGAGRFLKERGVKLISMQPDSPYHGLEGLKHMESALVPGIYDASLADAELEVATEEAYDEARRLARNHGWFVGISAAANLVAARRVAAELEEGVVVTMICDGGVKYLNERFWL